MLIDRTRTKKRTDRDVLSRTFRELYPNYHKIKENCMLLKYLNAESHKN